MFPATHVAVAVAVDLIIIDEFIAQIVCLCSSNVKVYANLRVDRTRVRIFVITSIRYGSYACIIFYCIFYYWISASCALFCIIRHSYIVWIFTHLRIYACVYLYSSAYAVHREWESNNNKLTWEILGYFVNGRHFFFKFRNHYSWARVNVHCPKLSCPVWILFCLMRSNVICFHIKFLCVSITIILLFVKRKKLFMIYFIYSTE